MSGTNRDTIKYFPIYMRHCTVFQPNKDDHKVVLVATVNFHIKYIIKFKNMF